jgi:hypothetical protein
VPLRHLISLSSPTLACKTCNYCERGTQPHATSHPMAARAPAAPDAPIDLDATVARLRALPTPQKISLSGALAVLMGRRSHGWNLEAVHPGTDGPPFCAWLLEHIMVVLLQLPAELLEGLKPLTEPQA